LKNDITHTYTWDADGNMLSVDGATVARLPHLPAVFGRWASRTSTSCSFVTTAVRSPDES